MIERVNLLDRVVTLDEVLATRPCWLREDGGRARLDRIAQQRVTWTFRDVLALPQSVVSRDDRWWIVVELLSAWGRDDLLRLIAADCALRALVREREAGREPDPRSWEAVRVARDFALGDSTPAQLSSARDAAWVAAWDAARDAARDAAWVAAWDAARDAAWAAAWAAARDAAWTAAGDAAWTAAGDAAWVAAGDAERDQQVARLVGLLDWDARRGAK